MRLPNSIDKGDVFHKRGAPHDRAIAGRSIAACALTLILCSCRQNVDLSGVQTLAATAASAVPSYSAVANDYYDSCLRYNGWVQLAENGILTNAQGQVNAILTALPSPAPLPSGAPAVHQMPPSEVAQANSAIAKVIGADSCEATQLAVTDWLHADSAVLDYMAALGKVAGGSKPTDFGFNTLTSNVKSLSSAQSSAVGTFLNDLFNQYFDIERRSDIATSAESADASLGTVCAFLVAAATEYKKQLARERGEINTFYSFNLGQPNPKGLERARLVEFEVDWQAKLAAVDEKITAASAYIESVDSIRKAHAALVASIKTNNIQSMSSVASTFVSDFYPKLVAIQKAFK
jgi:hypothetical protein